MPRGPKGEKRLADVIGNVDDWQVAGIKEAIKSLDRGEGISHERVKEWVKSWGSSNELPRPVSSET